jgi:hypothetical protein
VTRGAGGGRPAKPEAQRRNRANTSTNALSTSRKASIPKPIRALNDTEAALWRALWRAPEASRWRDVDRGALTRVVELAATKTDDVKLLAELRQLEDRFGLSPHARKVLGWQDVDEPAAPAAPAFAERDGRAGALKVLRGLPTAVGEEST